MDKCGKKFKNFCYICGKVTIRSKKVVISNELAKIYEEYFSMPVFRDVWWAPEFCCRTCSSNLYGWNSERILNMPFGTPVVWCDPGEHNPENCYVCVNNVFGLNSIYLRKFQYKSVASAGIPLPHNPNTLPPKPFKVCQSEIQTNDQNIFNEPMESEYDPPQSAGTIACKHVEITQEYFNKMVRKLKLSGRKSDILRKMLKDVNVLSPDVTYFGTRNRHSGLLPFFACSEDNTFAYCNNIPGLMVAMNIKYIPDEWRLFIDSSKRSLKAVLLNKNNSINPVPLAMSSNTTESYESMKLIIDCVQYSSHKWKICADIKVINILVGLQSGYTRNMCYLCLWNTRYKGDQYESKNWPSRQEYVNGKNNVIRTPLVPPEKVLLPPLHIKLGIVKNFIKALHTNEAAFNRLKQIFPRLSSEKVKEGELYNFELYFNRPENYTLIQAY